MEDNVVTLWNIPYVDIPITNVVLMSWIAMAVIILWAVIATRKFKPVPKGKQNMAEIVVEVINNFCEKMIGKSGKKFAAYIGTIGLFLGVSNLLGAFFASGVTNGVLCPPTRTMAVPVAFAVMTILIAIGAGIHKKGIIGFIKRLFKPIPIMFPFNILEFLIKPLSLSMRLFGNIFGAYITMELLLHALPWGIPAVASLYFDIFDGGLQTFVFVLLTTLYINEEVEDEEEEVEEKPVYRTEVEV